MLQTNLRCAMLVILTLAMLGGCATQPAASANFNCSSGETISPEQALQIALQAKGIADPSGYELSVDRDEIGFYVSFKAKDESKIPSFGTVAIDYCGKVITATAPL